jgi:NAD(P)-dependent dehydrogenase (short-subunit alcohol dehydrogenase family)
MELVGTVSLITGGAVRIGRAITMALAKAGSHVVIHYRQSAREARELVEQLCLHGLRASCVRADLSRPSAAERLVERVRREVGPVDVLVNNAAVFHKQSWWDLTPQDLRAELAVNLESPLALMVAFARQRRPGVIVNLLDRRIVGYDPSCPAYELSKKALAEATRAAALALAPDIRVNAVAPGVVLPPPGQGERYLRDRAGKIPLGRRIRPEEIADAVMCLIRADSVTGQILWVDGGQHLLGSAVNLMPT